MVAKKQTAPKAARMPLPKGRPSKYSIELANSICEQISQGKSLSIVCKGEGMPSPATVFSWLNKYSDFSENYARACVERSEAMMEEMFAIIDDSSNDWMTINGMRVVNRENVERSKARVDLRKWYLSKMKPKKYGDQISIDGEIRHITPLLGGRAKATEAIEGEIVDPVDDLIGEV